MVISDLSVKRPVFATVIGLLLVAFGLVAYERLPLREYPDIDPPIVSIETTYPGASAAVVDTKITELIERRISGVEGIRFIESVSKDGESDITVEFNVDRDIDEAANDIRDRVSGLIDNLPLEADPPDIQKVDSNDDVVMWLNLVSDRMTAAELTDYAERYLVDRFSVLDGVARVRVGGGQSYAMRVWLDRAAMAARGITSEDVEQALRAENVELPAGTIESVDLQFTARVAREFQNAEDFRGLVLGRSDDGYLVRLGEVARVEKGVVEDRTFLRGNQVPMVGIGIVKQSRANTVAVAQAALAESKRINPTLPEGMEVKESFDSSVFIQYAIQEVYETLFVAMALVVLVIYLFLGSVRAMAVPAVTVPVSLIGTFVFLYAFDFSINLITLLGLVLVIGMVVDDAIVVLENIVRRIDQENEPPLLAAFRGARQVAFAVIATTLVLVSVFVPIAFLEGDLGRLFTEFSITLAAAVSISSLVALTISPMLASKLLSKDTGKGRLVAFIEDLFLKFQSLYGRLLRACMRVRYLAVAGFLCLLAATVWLFNHLTYEYAPKEDRGAFYVIVTGPEGATFAYMEEYMDEIEQRLMKYVENGEMTRLLVRAPSGWGNIESFNSGRIIAVLSDWQDRRTAWEIMDEIRQSLADLPGVRAVPVMRQSFGGRVAKPVQFVIGGGDYKELAEWRDTLLAEIDKDNPGLRDIDWDYKETKPQLDVEIDYARAGELGVKVGVIGRTLETMLGSRRVTTFIERGEEYDVIVEGERERQRTPTDLENIYVRSDRTNELIPLTNLVTVREYADSTELNRYNRLRAITIEADLVEGYALGEALDYLDGLAREHLPEDAIIDYKGQSRDLRYSTGSLAFVFILGLVVVYLVLAAQFESFMHPFVIILTVPLAMFGGLLGIYLTGGTLNIYSQIGLIMLVGLASKNGILIVEFANQLRNEGIEFMTAIVEASQLRLRPILMTGITTAAGSVPLVVSSGAGAETRFVIGVVVICGVLAATFLTLFVVPTAYALLGRVTKPANRVERMLEEQMENWSPPGSPSGASELAPEADRTPNTTP